MSKKHWLDEILRSYFIWVYEAGAQDRGDLPELTRQCKLFIHSTIETKLPEEKVWDMSMDETGREVDAWNECLKQIKEALEIE